MDIGDFLQLMTFTYCYINFVDSNEPLVTVFELGTGIDNYIPLFPLTKLELKQIVSVILIL